jgi:hypothetical protein
MEEKIKNLTETVADAVEAYYFRLGIVGKPEVSAQVQDGKLMATIYTANPISYDDMRLINKIVWSFIPAGMPYELINLAAPQIAMATPFISEDTIYEGVQDEKPPVSKKKPNK